MSKHHARYAERVEGCRDEAAQKIAQVMDRLESEGDATLLKSALRDLYRYGTLPRFARRYVN